MRRQSRVATQREEFRLERLTSNPLLQRHAIQELHGDEGAIAFQSDFINGADIRMVQRRGNPGKLFKSLKFMSQFVWKKLQGNTAIPPPSLSMIGRARWSGRCVSRNPPWCGHLRLRPKASQ